uniref:DDE_3 domain-containing protein n=1 Tax=Heterorhabditis bacteriophora TaxID=37862 RepID=A0A1I7WSH2_HETBA
MLWDAMELVDEDEQRGLPGCLRTSISFTFQQDNVTIHTNRSTKIWLKNSDVDTLDWPSRSLNLNPMENLWASLVRRNNANNPQFETIKDLQSATSKA